MSEQKSRVYIDAFNLYYGSLRNTPYKWLNILALSRSLVGGEPDLVKYFTARVKPNVLEQDQPVRQRAYLHALETLRPNVEIYFGRYVSREKRVALWDPPHTKVSIIHHEEKGSDVNLATHLVADAHCNKFTRAFVISNDSDLEAPVRHVKSLGLNIVVVNPHKADTRSEELKRAASAVRDFRPGVLARCQFPDEIVHGGRKITKPLKWRV